MKLGSVLFSLILFFLLTTFVRSEELDQKTNIMLKPIIISLAIPKKSNDSSAEITIVQDKILQALKPFQTENITRYRYSPLMAVSVEQAGIDMLQNLEEVISIEEDGLNSSQNETTHKAQKTPCNK